MHSCVRPAVMSNSSSNEILVVLRCYPNLSLISSASNTPQPMATSHTSLDSPQADQGMLTSAVSQEIYSCSAHSGESNATAASTLAVDLSAFLFALRGPDLLADRIVSIDDSSSVASDAGDARAPLHADEQEGAPTQPTATPSGSASTTEQSAAATSSALQARKNAMLRLAVQRARESLRQFRKKSIL